jgi:hypothetical protein
VPACAEAIRGILHIFIRAHARRRGHFSREEMVEQVLDYYVNGLRPDQAPPDRGRTGLTAVPAGDD